MRLRIIGLLLLVVFPFSLKAVKLDISVFDSFNKTEVVFFSLSGKYTVVASKDTVVLMKGDELRIVVENDSILRLYDGLRIVGKSSEIQFSGKGFLRAFSLHLVGKPTKVRDYDDDLIIRVVKGKMQLINRVDLEHYTAGVVQSEALGSSKDLQFFFVQAITCRTYALVNYLKHADEGFNLCDDVHCQYYTGRCRNADISRATARTSGDVIVDNDKRMISAAFHSNCGGQTVKSEDVWSIPTSYLKSVKDSFCIHETNATWRYAMAKDDWLAFLKKQYAYPIDNPKMRIKAYTFKQSVRKVYFENNIPLKDIRRDLHLRSTFFTLESKKDSVVFHGRGYGHGVGLCQQGAIHMADLGIDYREIIKFYYSDTRIIHYSELRYDFMP
jgi:stage II sporulation protein D